jgi:acetyl-CoA carboxylase biotin carboxyl carrier protein
MNPKASQHAKRAQTEQSQDSAARNDLLSRNDRHQIVDLEFLRGLIAAVDESGIDSLEVSRAGTRIRIAKSAPAAPVAAMPSFAHSHPAPAPAPAEPAAAPAAAEPAAPAPAKSNLIDIKSPMVGTFYRAPAPEAPSYVESGSRVVKGQTLCILEAMKLMNELESEVSGTVREICVENAEPVEYGQVLFRIEPEA